jgi:hypothetical protein
MRQLKHHEQKLLRKVSLYSWKGEDNLRVAKILRRYHIQNREDYVAYSKICGMVTKLAAKLKVRVPSCFGFIVLNVPFTYNWTLNMLCLTPILFTCTLNGNRISPYYNTFTAYRHFLPKILFELL